MTGSEDVYRVVNTPTTAEHTSEYLHARIDALEKRVKYLEAVIEVEILNHNNNEHWNN